MSVKIYAIGGVILAEEAGKDTESFTPQNTDLWVSGDQVGFTDSLSKQTIVFGNFDNIVMKNDEVPATLPEAIIYMASLFNSGVLELLKNPTFTTQVALGKIPGIYPVHKFGENPEITTNTDPEDVWNFGGIYIFSDSAIIDSISSSAGDTVDITIEGLDENWDVVIQTITLTGQARKALTTNLIRVYRAFNANATDLIGNVYIYENTTLNLGVPVDITKTRAEIQAAANQTEMMIYSVPAGKTAVYMEGFIAISRGGGVAASAEMTFRSRLFEKTFRVKRRIALNTQGSSSWRAVYTVPVILPEKSDLIFRCEEVSATLGVSGGFQALIFDNEMWEL